MYSPVWEPLVDRILEWRLGCRATALGSHNLTFIITSNEVVLHVYAFYVGSLLIVVVLKKKMVFLFFLFSSSAEG